MTSCTQDMERDLDLSVTYSDIPYDDLKNDITNPSTTCGVISSHKNTQLHCLTSFVTDEKHSETL